MKISIVVALSCIVVLPLTSSCESRETKYSKIVHQRCSNDQSKCSTDCKKETFRYCYYYPEKMKKENFDIRADCLGLHVGSLCSPCEDIYTLNFGGALQQVKCEEFYQSLYARDKKCNNCIKKGEYPE